LVPLETVFAAASSEQVQMTVRTSPTDFHPSLNSVGSPELHGVLAKVAGNPPGSWPVPNLGLLYAPFYRPNPSVYGLMFDKGFDDETDPHPETIDHRQPREGCAVFLGAIRETGLDPEDFERQVAFTTVHEVAHLFNLQHTELDPCFLNTSTLEAPELRAFRFLHNPHESQMARVETDFFVAPGGAPFGESGIFANTDMPKGGREVKPSVLRLEADITPDIFWPWEPVELDVRLFFEAGRWPRRLKIPNQLDPGYTAFEIWIEEPSGQRRRYRPLRHYCAFPNFLEAKPGTMWERDISIFYEAGGYTFRQAGIHRVWVRFQTPPGHYLQSEPCEVTVRSYLDADRRSRQRSEEMETHLRQARRLLYLRAGIPRKQEARALRALASKFSNEHTGAAAAYALARMAVSQKSRQGLELSPAAAARLLAVAAEHPKLSQHRRHLAENLAKPSMVRSERRHR
jgi:hypothetical protein